jgi:hypothetical protein
MANMAGKRGNGEGSACQRTDGKRCAASTLDGGKRKVVCGRTRKEVADKHNRRSTTSRRDCRCPA